jgi:hypothetical protein
LIKKLHTREVATMARPISKYFISYNPIDNLYRAYKNKEGIRPLIHTFQRERINVRPYNEEFMAEFAGRPIRVRKLGEVICYNTRSVFSIYNFPSSTYLKSSPNNILPGDLFTNLRSQIQIPVNNVQELKLKAVRENDSCGICLEPLTMENSIVTSCGHVFVRGAFERWRQISTKCPVCRSVCNYV